MISTIFGRYSPSITCEYNGITPNKTCAKRWYSIWVMVIPPFLGILTNWPLEKKQKHQWLWPSSNGCMLLYATVPWAIQLLTSLNHDTHLQELIHVSCFMLHVVATSSASRRGSNRDLGRGERWESNAVGNGKWPFSHISKGVSIARIFGGLIPEVTWSWDSKDSTCGRSF